jgi:hypothetical protein
MGRYFDFLARLYPICMFHCLQHGQSYPYHRRATVCPGGSGTSSRLRLHVRGQPIFAEANITSSSHVSYHSQHLSTPSFTSLARACANGRIQNTFSQFPFVSSTGASQRLPFRDCHCARQSHVQQPEPAGTKTPPLAHERESGVTFAKPHAFRKRVPRNAQAGAEALRNEVWSVLPSSGSWWAATVVLLRHASSPSTLLPCALESFCRHILTTAWKASFIDE